MPISSVKLSRDLTSLICKNHLAKPVLKNLRPNRSQLKKFTQGCIEGAIRRGVCEFLYHEGQLKACFVLLYVQFAPGLPFYWGFVETDRSKKSEKWVLEKLKEHSSFFTENTMLDLPFYLKAMLPQIYKLGYFVDTVRTVGRTHDALEKLMLKRKPERTVFGYTIEKVKNIRELKQVQKIERHEFKRNPQYGWFVASEPWLKHQLSLRAAKINSPEALLCVIKKGKRVLGYFGYTPEPNHFGGISGGTEFVFDKSIQGKGFSFVGYRLMLEHMLANKVEILTGNTSQPAVLQAARIMGRTPQNYALRFGRSFFRAQYFDI